MITIYSACWHDDGIVECYAILQNVFTKECTLRAARGKLIDVREALYDAWQAFGENSDQGEDRDQWYCIFDALAFVTSAMTGPGGSRNSIQMAMRCLERLKVVNHVHQA